MAHETDGWIENRKLIVAELQRISGEVQSVREKFDEVRREEIAQIKTEIALLKFKASLWGSLLGGLAGMLVSLGAVLMRFIK